MKDFRWMLIFFLMASGLARAREPEEIRVTLQAISLGDTHLEGLFFHNGRRMQTLHAPASHFHRPVSYAGPNPMTLFVEREDAAADESPYRPVGRIDLPANTDAVVLLLNRLGDEVRGNAVPLREQGFSIGTLLMMNLSEREVLLTFGEDAFRIQNGRVQMIRPNLPERGVVPMVYRFADDVENESLVSSGWFYHPERRYFVFLFDNQGQVGMRSVTWFPPRDPP